MSENKIAVFPGSFDPITIGHVDIVKRAIPLFDQIIIAIGVNSQKKYMFPLEKRMDWIKKIFSGEKKVTVDNYSGLTVDFCEKNKAQYILRGLRSTIDFEFEKAIGQMNNEMKPAIETVIFLSKQKYTSVNSTIIRDIIMNGGNASAFLPEIIASDISAK